MEFIHGRGRPRILLTQKFGQSFLIDFVEIERRTALILSDARIYSLLRVENVKRTVSRFLRDGRNPSLVLRDGVACRMSDCG